MIRKTSKIIGVLLLIGFSFFYTDKAVDIVKRNDPIMKEIISKNDKYMIKPIDSKINNNEITSGVYGKKIDIDKSYSAMKSENVFNETLLIFNDVIPNKSILNTFDKFVVRGSTIRNEIALVFKIEDINNLEKLTNIIDEKNIPVTLFIDGNILENNIEKLSKINKSNYDIENFGYNDEYNKNMVEWTNNLIFSITNIYPEFCYSEFNNYQILDTCSKEKMYTVKPITITNDPFITIKNTCQSGNIYSMNINDEVLRELPVIINYIFQKGFNLVDLKTIILEDRILEK